MMFQENDNMFWIKRHEKLIKQAWFLARLFIHSFNVMLEYRQKIYFHIHRTPIRISFHNGEL